LEAQLEATKPHDRTVVVLSQDLPGVKDLLVVRVGHLKSDWLVRNVVAVACPGFEFPDEYKVVSLPADGVTREAVSALLRRLSIRPLAIPSVTIDPLDDLILDELVRSLDENRDLTRSLSILGRMIAGFVNWKAASVSRLTQGYSGARVFVVRRDDGTNAADSFVLKVTTWKDRWKIWNELENWTAIESALNRGPQGRRFGALKWHVPPLLPPTPPNPRLGNLVEVAGFCVSAYQFLGGTTGRFLSLEEVYLLSAVELGSAVAGTPYAGREGSLAEVVLDDLLTLLKKAWYSGASYDTRTLWSSEDAPFATLLRPPPYRLSAWQKAHLLGSLEEIERLGKRLLKQEWDAAASNIRRWLASRPEDSPVWGNLPVVLSAVHGDLNSNNVRIWLDEAQPFLIDFACYQSKGHTFQDFARLEAEIKFALMNRENDSTLTAFDLTDGQFDVWRETEAWLASLRWCNTTTSPLDMDVSTKKAVKMILHIRMEAKEIHERVCPTGRSPDHFHKEYGSALLYYALRAIGYGTLSPLKRVLAVWSASLFLSGLRNG
jgi:hypothetical protein